MASSPPLQADHLQHLTLVELLGGDADVLLDEPLFEVGGWVGVAPLRSNDVRTTTTPTPLQKHNTV